VEGTGEVAYREYVGPSGVRLLVIVFAYDSSTPITNEAWTRSAAESRDQIATTATAIEVPREAAFAPDVCRPWFSVRTSDVVFGDRLAWGIAQCLVDTDLMIVAMASGQVRGNTDALAATEAIDAALVRAGVLDGTGQRIAQGNAGDEEAQMSR
jgi:hypothetical protein